MYNRSVLLMCKSTVTRARNYMRRPGVIKLQRHRFEINAYTLHHRAEKKKKNKLKKNRLATVLNVFSLGDTDFISHRESIL